MTLVRVAVALVAAVVVSLPARAQPSPALLNPADRVFAQRGPERFHVLLDTSQGFLLLDVSRRLSPRGADRFYHLVRHGFYDEARFFRVIAGRFAQFGVPADPAAAQAWRDAAIPDDSRVASNVRGAVSYAFATPDGRTTQVFINLTDNSAEFDPEPFVPFAHVIDGMEVADRLNAEYGEAAGGGIRAGKQAPLFLEGLTFLQREFPRLDYIRRASVIFEIP